MTEEIRNQIKLIELTPATYDKYISGFLQIGETNLAWSFSKLNQDFFFWQ